MATQHISSSSCSESHGQSAEFLLLLLRSGDIETNPGPEWVCDLLSGNVWKDSDEAVKTQLVTKIIIALAPNIIILLKWK